MRLPFARLLAAVACAHEWTPWVREERTLRGPYGITGPHYYQIRHCVKCQWQQEADVERIKT